MSGLTTWRPGDTPYPGKYLADGAGNPVPDADVVQLLAWFKLEDGTVLAKFCKTAKEGFELLNKTSETVDEDGAVWDDPVDVYRFPIDNTITDAWTATEGKVRLVVKIRMTSDVFTDNGYRKVFDQFIAQIKPGEIEDL